MKKLLTAIGLIGFLSVLPVAQAAPTLPGHAQPKRISKLLTNHATTYAECGKLALEAYFLPSLVSTSDAKACFDAFKTEATYVGETARLIASDRQSKPLQESATFLPPESSSKALEASHSAAGR